MKDFVNLEATYPDPPERVWEALTDPNALGRWLLPTNFKPLIGFRFRMERQDQKPIEGKVLEVEKDRLLTYTWNDEDEGKESMVVWTLEPVDGGTRVQVQHIGIEEPAVTCLAIDYYFNWRQALRRSLPRLLQLLRTGVTA